jgi:condensin-2 complex subunit G2
MEALRTRVLKTATAAPEKLRELLPSTLTSASAQSQFVELLSPEKAATLCAALVQPTLATLQAIVGTDEGGDGAVNDENAGAGAGAVAFLGAVAGFLHAWCEDPERQLSPDFEDLAVLLHNTMYQLPSTPEYYALRASVCRLCERLYLQNRPFRNSLIVFTLPALFLRTLELDASEADVRRVWAMREALKLFDLDAETPESAGVLNILLP